MKTKTINLYEFSELPEDAREKAIEKLWDINVEFDWWQFSYYDAEQIGLKITGFDLDRGDYVTGHFVNSACEVAQDIINNHGENTETYKAAVNFLELHNPVFANYLDENHKDYESQESEDKLQEIEEEFLSDVLHAYKIYLKNEYEYLTSKQAIIETIEANDYLFNEKGDIESL